MNQPVDAKRLNPFERYLSAWVALCIVAGVALGTTAPGFVGALSRLEVRHVNLPIAVLIWLMIYPMMLRIDFAAVRGVGRRPKGILVVLFVNWLVKPFSMAVLGWLFFKHLFAGLIGPELGDQYLAGAIILAAAPCTAMVFVWSYLTDGDPAYTLVQVALNDLIMLVAFAPIVILLLGVSNITVPYDVLFYSVVLYIVIPLAAGALSRTVLLRARGPVWFDQVFLERLKPVAILALLATLVLIFAFQGEVILGRLSHIVLIAIPLLIQVYFNSGLAYGLARWFRVPARGGGARSADRREQLLRAGRGDGDLAVRAHVGRDAGDRGRRARRGAGDAVGVRVLQPDAPLVRGDRRRRGAREPGGRGPAVTTPSGALPLHPQLGPEPDGGGIPPRPGG